MFMIKKFYMDRWRSILSNEKYNYTSVRITDVKENTCDLSKVTDLNSAIIIYYIKRNMIHFC